MEDMVLANDAHIDAFALNMAHGEIMNEAQLEVAFDVARQLKFQLFFSFDYAGSGAWPKEAVVQYITKWGSNSQYFKHQGKPFVSTFEGPERAEDWIEIKDKTGCFFMPDWSSLGAQAAMAKAGGVADGLFSWAAWPWGFRDMDTYTDASYKQFLGGKPYMMPVSPWFYTNMPGYNKNWPWRGDNIWADRWLQIEWWQPEFVQIISWNDYGESHHIVPLRDKAMVAFDTGRAPFNYALEHDGWREFLPFSIDRYKTGSATITHEGIVGWWRPNPHGACRTGGTTANTASQLQFEFSPTNILEDAIFYSVLLQSRHDKVNVYVGSDMSPAGFYMAPEGGAGLYHGKVALNGRKGRVRIEVWRGGEVVVELAGRMPITDECNNGYANYNAFVQSSQSTPTISVAPPPVHNLVCVNGTGVGDFEAICGFTCSTGYCPETACVCTKMGKQPVPSPDVKVVGYPAEGRDSSFAGLCAVSCRLGQCERFKKLGVCDDKQHPYVIPDVSPFLPLTCTGGSGGEYSELCEFTCKHGYCPMAGGCSCTHMGHLDLLEPTSFSNATTYAQDDSGLCAFACSRAFCPRLCHTMLNPEEDGYGPGYDPLTDTYIDGQEPPEEWACKAVAVRDSLDGLQESIDNGSIPNHCRARFALRALISELDGFEDEFNKASEGYDDLFGYYEDWVKDQIDPQLDSFMSWTGKGNKHFTCTFREDHVEKTQPCPPPENIRNNQERSFTVTYHLVDPDGFYAALLAEFGIEKSWIKFGENKDLHYCIPNGYEPYSIPGGGPETSVLEVRSDPCTHIYHTRAGFPMANRDQVHPGNPKAVIQAALPNITALSDTLLQQYFTAAGGGDGADPGDAVTAAAMPVLMLQSAVDSMVKIKEIAADEKERQKKHLILMILSIVLMVVPFVGEAIGAAFGGVAMIGRIALLIGEAGNVALTAYDVVEDPLSAPFAILGLVVTPFKVTGRSSRVVFREAADLRRALKDEDLRKFGDKFHAKDAKVQKILGTCSR